MLQGSESTAAGLTDENEKGQVVRLKVEQLSVSVFLHTIKKHQSPSSYLMMMMILFPERWHL